MNSKALIVAGLVIAMAGTVDMARAVSAPHDGSAASARCPGTLSLAAGGPWHNRALARGVSVSHRHIPDARGIINLYVLRAHLDRPGIHVKPLFTTLAHRAPLSGLARRRPGLVAATNTGYFDFTTGAPTGPLIDHDRPLVLSRQREAVVGIVHGGRVSASQAWLSGQIRTPHHQYPIVAINELWPPAGLSVYTSTWGRTNIPLHGGVSRAVSASGLVSPIGRYDTVTKNGYLILATDAAARRALTHIRTATSITVATTVHTSNGDAFHQAYGVGSQLVAHHGHSISGFRCLSANTDQPARTAIGMSDGGRELVIAVVTDHPFTRQHGLDNTQMSKLMTQLGVNRAFDLDGSGSTELLAKVSGSSRLARLTYAADGHERKMPLGLGVFDR